MPRPPFLWPRDMWPWMMLNGVYIKLCFYQVKFKIYLFTYTDNAVLFINRKVKTWINLTIWYPYSYFLVKVLTILKDYLLTYLLIDIVTFGKRYRLGMGRYHNFNSETLLICTTLLVPVYHMGQRAQVTSHGFVDVNIGFGVLAVVYLLFNELLRWLIPRLTQLRQF